MNLTGVKRTHREGATAAGPSQSSSLDRWWMNN